MMQIEKKNQDDLIQAVREIFAGDARRLMILAIREGSPADAEAINKFKESMIANPKAPMEQWHYKLSPRQLTIMVAIMATELTMSNKEALRALFKDLDDAPDLGIEGRTN